MHNSIHCYAGSFPRIAMVTECTLHLHHCTIPQSIQIDARIVILNIGRRESGHKIDKSFSLVSMFKSTLGLGLGSTKKSDLNAYLNTLEKITQ